MSIVINGTGTITGISEGGLNDNIITTNEIKDGAVTVAKGGTGAATLTANNVILGNGTSAVQFVAPGASGNVLTSNGTTWTSAAPAGGAPTTQQVLSATAGASVGAIGTYAWLNSSSTIGSAVTLASPGGTVAGSSLRYSGFTAAGVNLTSPMGPSFSSTAPSGTWRCMGYAYNNDGEGSRYVMTSWLRIS